MRADHAAGRGASRSGKSYLWMRRGLRGGAMKSQLVMNGLRKRFSRAAVRRQRSSRGGK